MKTKHILTAMVLPTLLAACTADEIVENNNNNLVAQGRAEVEAVSFAINGEGSRLAFNEETLGWDWEDTDKFLLFPADNGEDPYVGTKANPAHPGQRFTVGDNLVSGYEYEKNADGGYTTKAAVMGEGLYWGYAPSFNKTARGLIEYNLATSQDVEYYKSEAAQAFITPLYEVNAEIYNNELPLEMINWYTTAIFPLKNNTKQDLNLKQIVVRSDNPFLVKGEININAMGQYIMAYDGKKWDAVQNYNNDKNDNLDLKKGEFIDEFRKEYMAKEGEDGLTSKLLLLNLEGEVLEAGETKTYYMLLPATADKIDCSIVIMTEEGYVEISETSQSNYLKNTQIYHNGQKAAFGWQTIEGKNVAKPYVIKSTDLNDNDYDTKYVASYEDMMKLINTVNGTFRVFNVGDWAVDAKMAKAITDSDSEVIFDGSVVLKDTEEIKLNKVTFDADVIIKKGTKVAFVEDINKTVNKQWGVITIEEDAELIVEDCNLGGTIIVEEGAALNVTKNADAYAYVENKGNVTLEDQKNVTVKQLGGVLNLNKHEGTDSFEYSTRYIKFEQDATFETIVAEDVTFVVDEDITLYRNKAKGTMATLVVNGDVELNANVRIEGEMTIEGDTDGRNGALYVGADGELTNEGYAETDVVIEEDGTVYQNGTAKEIYNNGLVVAGKGSKSTIVDGDKDARVDNSRGGAVTNKAEQVVYYTLENGDVDDLEDITFAKWSINTLVVEGTLDMNRPFSENADAEQLTSTLTTLEIADKARIEVDGDVHVFFEKVILMGDAEVNGYRYETSSLTFDLPVTVTMKNKHVKSGNSCYTLELNDVAVGGENVSFKTVDGEKVEGGVKYNIPEIKTEDATLTAEVDGDRIVINEANVTEIDVVGTLDELKEALSDENKAIINLHRSVINLDSDLTIKRDVTITGGTLEGHSVTVAPDATVTFDGVTFLNVKNANKDASSLYYKDGKGTLTVKNCTFNGFEWDAIQIVGMTANTSVVIEKNTFKAPNVYNEGGSYVHVANASTEAKSIRILDNTFGDGDNMEDYMVKVYGFKSNNVVVGGNKYLSGYQEKSVLMCPKSDYETCDEKYRWNGRSVYKVLVGKTVKLGTYSESFQLEYDAPENL